MSAPAQARPPLVLAPQVDLNRMRGGWYLIATIPNWFERGMVAPYDVYTPLSDGSIAETFYLQKSSFSAPRRRHSLRDFVRPGTGNADWRVEILWPLKLPFRVLYVDPAYQYALFGEDNRNLGWIYARTPDVPPTQYQALLDRMRGEGYDTTRFKKFVQRPDQIGQPGFWSDGIHP